MKESGRNIKRRLYALSLIGDRFSRAKHFRGHGVHSPFVYNMVRKVFMRRGELLGPDHALFDSLVAMGISRRRAAELQNSMAYCNATTFAIDNATCLADFNIFTEEFPFADLAEVAKHAAQNSVALVIISPYKTRERNNICNEIVEQHTSTSIDNRAYLILLNNHLPKQHFRL